MLRAILFDFNGVLIDDEPLHLEAFARVLAEAGHALDRAAYLELFFGRDDRSGLRAWAQAAGLRMGAADEARWLARKSSYYQQSLRAGGVPLRPAVVELARQAADAGRTLGVVSGAFRAEVTHALGRAGLLDRVKAIVAAEDVERGKPDPGGYLLALERLNTRSPLPERLFHPHEVAAIKDSPRGVAAARAAGLLVFGLVGPGFPADLADADRRLDEDDLDLPRLDRLAAEARR